MIPKTAFQKETDSIRKKVRRRLNSKDLTEVKNEFVKLGRVNTRHVLCFECFHKSPNTSGLKQKDKIICECCGKEITLYERLYYVNDYKYVMDAFVFKGYQIFRLYSVLRTINVKYRHTAFDISIINERWISINSGKELFFSKTLNMFGNYRANPYNMSSKVELRPRDNMYIHEYNLSTRAEFDKDFYRNGFTGDFRVFHPHALFRMLMFDKRAEILWKNGYYEFLEDKYYKAINSHTFWPSIRICVKHKYKIPDIGIWLDYIKLLIQLKKDVLNPKIICPENLQRAHDECSFIVIKKRKDEKIKEYKRLHQPWLDKWKNLVIEQDGILIRPILSIEEYKHIGSISSMCMYSNEYFKNRDSIVCIALIENEFIEAIEIDINTFYVLQSYGRQHSYSQYHDQILKIVNENKNLVKRVKNGKSIKPIRRKNSEIAC